MKSKAQTNRYKKPGRLLVGHIMFHTKYNRPMLKGKIRIRAEEIVRNTLIDLGCEVVKVSASQNYVRILFRYPPRLSIGKILNRVKGKSSCLLRREFPILKKQCQKALWAPKYGCLYS